MAQQDSPTRRFRHPGAGRGRAAAHPKGRQLDPAAIDAVAALLAEHRRHPPYPRDELIEYLHLIQDRFGCLSASHLAALARLTKLAQAEVYEVASFYAHFDIVREDEPLPPAVTVRVCDSLTCAMHGAEDLLSTLEARIGRDVRIQRAPCMGRCHLAPAAAIGHNAIAPADAEAVARAATAHATHPTIPDAVGVEAYRGAGGYRLLEECYAGGRTPESVIESLEASGLRGLGGAGFPAGRKWRFVRQEPAPRLMAVNADEGEPGTFKDHHFMATDPHRFLEGMLIGAWAAEAEAVYIYLRDEYPEIRLLLQRELAALEAAGLTQGRRIVLRRGAGAYICGEESAMLESLEGKRGLPRHKPPYPTQVGLFGRPTLCHNVETLHWVRDILENGPEWFSGQGRHGRTGRRAYSVSGRVRQPGVKIAPAGITVQELIDEHCGGMADGHRFKGYLPGGASGGILPASMAGIPLDFDVLFEHGCFIGSAAVVVLSDQDDMAQAALNLMRFFEFESCGQCTPCRVGTEKAVKLMERPHWDVPLLKELSQVMIDASICGLGQAAPNPLNSLFKHFPEDVPADGTTDGPKEASK